LDEPTHNLDDKAINTLVDVIQNRLSGFLDQIFIVTHDEKLAEAGDNIIRIK
jgi:DNA repair exonuclease SbcCD ATPase subunit